MADTQGEPSSLRRIRLILWVAVAVVAVAATALFILRPPADPKAPGISYADQAFSLTRADGGTFTNADLKGTPTMMFFGYTSCPDVCPTTMADMLKWRTDTGIGYDKLRTVFVTVDPERDTAQMLKDYIGAFDPGITGLVGDAVQTETIKKIFGVVGDKAEQDATGFYLVNHTASVFLIGADGTFQGTIAYGEDNAAAEAKIKRLVNG
ncbi:MAG: SCO family protein [Devosia sp.]